MDRIFTQTNTRSKLIQDLQLQMGDGTNFVIILAGEMLKMAEGLLRLGLHPSEIVQGYEKAQDFALKALDGLEHQIPISIFQLI